MSIGSMLAAAKSALISSAVLIHLPNDTKTLSDSFGLVAAFKAVKRRTTNGGMGCFASLSFLAAEAFTRT
ncbi:MAG: hypothetical protein JXB29_12445 [Sedimentisphaerales bacterium]|nr:hypothetical protein [Sedimentisphaerales bacterium]